MVVKNNYIVICWYFDKDGIECFKNVNPIEKLLTFEEAQKLLIKMSDNFKNSKIEGFNRLGEEIVTLEKYNILLETNKIDTLEEVLPGINLLTAITSEKITFGELVDGHIKPEEKTETDVTIEELIQSVFSEPK